MDVLNDPSIISALECDILNMSEIQYIIEMAKRKEIIAQYPYKIWKDTRGYFNCYIPKVNEDGKIHIRRAKQSDVEDAIIRFVRETEDNPTVLELYERWSKYQQDMNLIAPSTVTRNDSFVKKHLKGTSLARKRIRSVMPMELTKFLEEQIAQYNMTSKAFSGLKHIISGICWQAGRDGLINWTSEDVFARLYITKKSFRIPHTDEDHEVYTEEETQLMIGYLIEHQDLHNMGILLMFVTGMRVGELVCLKPEDFTDKTVRICRCETRFKDSVNGQYVYGVKDSPKTIAGYRTIVIPEQAQWIVNKLLEMSCGQEYVFMRKGKRMLQSAIRDRLYKLCDKLMDGRKSPHKIRKTYASILLDKGLDSRLVMDQLGHVSVSISEQYYHKNRKTIERKQSILSSISDFEMVCAK